MVHGLDFDLGLHRLAATDGGRSGDYIEDTGNTGWQLYISVHQAALFGVISFQRAVIL